MTGQGQNPDEHMFVDMGTATQMGQSLIAGNTLYFLVLFVNFGIKMIYVLIFWLIPLAKRALPVSTDVGSHYRQFSRGYNTSYAISDS